MEEVLANGIRVEPCSECAMCFSQQQLSSVAQERQLIMVRREPSDSGNSDSEDLL